tara:strand:- start:398 stop:631 length:234 start_codon:yes stop_codon:yes gene_type:complete
MTDITISINETVNPHYYIVRPNTKNARKIVAKCIGDRFQEIDKLYAVDKKELLDIWSLIKTNGMNFNTINISTEGKH